MSSTVPDTAKVVVTLSDTDITVDPGHVTRVTVDITNKQHELDRMLVDVEGIDIEWVNIPVPAVNIGAGEKGQVIINFRVGRTSENPAGSYPFVVKVQAMETGEVGLAQAILTVKEYRSLQLDMNPRRASATFTRPLNDFDIQVLNLGNVEQTVELTALDPDEECAFEFDMDRLNLRPGESTSIPLVVRPKYSSWIGKPRLFGFTVTARSVEDNYINSKTQGQIERYSLISPALGVFFLLMILGAGGYLLLKPNPPARVRISSFTVTPQTAVSGSSIMVSWNVQGDYKRFTLSENDASNQIYYTPPSAQESSGNMKITLNQVSKPTTERFVFTASGPGGRVSSAQDVTVNPAPLPPKPELTNFETESSEIHDGEEVNFSWVGANASSYILDPGDQKLSGEQESLQLKPNPPSLPYTYTYTLRAMPLPNSLSKPVKRSVTVTVVSPSTCISKVIGFRVVPSVVYFGAKVQLKWDVLRAQTVSIVDDLGNTLGTGLPSEGHLDVTVNAVTKYTLTATDNGGQTTSTTLQIVPQPRPIPTITAPSGTQTGPTTTPGNSTSANPANSAPASK